MEPEAVEKLLEHPDPNIQVQSLNFLMEHTQKKSLNLEKDFLRILKLLVKCSNMSSELLASFVAYFKFDDIRLLSFKLLQSCILEEIKTLEEFSQINKKDRKAAREMQKLASENCFFILKILQPNTVANQLYFPSSNEVIYKEQKTEYERCWIKYLSRLEYMPNHLSLPILDHVVNNVIQHFISSYLLLDFFSNCYDALNREEDPAKQTRNNEIAIIALQGLFLLIYHHNNDYPDFFPKMYRLMTPSIVNSTLSHKLIKMVYDFLQNPSLPSYVIMSFMKRMARLALMSGAETSVLLLNVVYNLMAIHPLTQILIQKEINRDNHGGSALLLNTSIQIEKDPFRFEESDMHKCGAINSSLWEILVLMNHYSTPVATAAKSFKDNISIKSAFDIANVARLSYHELIVQESRKIKAGVPAQFVMPNTFWAQDQFPGCHDSYEDTPPEHPQLPIREETDNQENYESPWKSLFVLRVSRFD